MSHQRKRRVRQLLRCIPDILNHDTLLYIGASRKRMQLVELFDGAGYEITILEIWKENVEFLRKHTPCPPWNKRPLEVIQGDVRNVTELIGDRTFDVVMWWHGPEHLHLRELRPTVKKLEDLTRRTTVFGCPPKFYPQESERNPFERHFMTPSGEFWDSLGTWFKDIDSNNFLIWRSK